MTPYLIAIAVICVVFVFPAWLAFRKEEREAMAELQAAIDGGRHEPVSIRPWVDAGKCMGSGACLLACPEHAVLQVIDGQAQLVNATACVGHGACARACPRGAIELVFGSEKRGVDLPQVGPDFQSNVPGLYIAGELGGMGLIANAVEQGKQAAAHAMKRLPRGHRANVDVLVVGAGPAGLAAAMAVEEAGKSAMIVEQDVFGGAIRHYPRHKLVMSRAFQLPGQKQVKSGTLTKEELIAILTEQVEASGLRIHQNERVLGVASTDGGTFVISTDRREVHAARVILAVGRRGTPRKLEVPGEDRDKVAYRLLEPEQFAHRHVLVVGGGDSAVEAVIALGEQEGCSATLSYRKDHIVRPKRKNQEKLQAAVDAGAVDLLLGSTVEDIGADRVKLRIGEETVVLPNDAVLVFAGGVLPTKFLQEAGIHLERHHGKRIERLEQSVAS